jgi:periplasmic protein TorT
MLADQRRVSRGVLAAVTAGAMLAVGACSSTPSEATPQASTPAGGSSQQSKDFALVGDPIDILVPNADGTATSESVFTPPAKAGSKYHICASLPTMADSYWIAGAYGLTTEARRLGVDLDILNAGSYNNLSKQVADINDCAAQGADAILVAPISVDGVAPAIKNVRAAGIPVVNIVPRIPANDIVDAKATIDYYDLGLLAAKKIVDEVGPDAETTVGLFPGPPGADWAAKTVKGFEQGIKGSKVRVLDVKYGDISKDVQLNLINDVLSANPDLDWIIAEASGADAAVEATKSHGSSAKIGSIGTYPAVRQQLVDGLVDFCLLDNVVWMASMGVDLAVKLLDDDKLEHTEIWPVPGVLTKDNAMDEPSAGFAPEGYKPIFQVRS